jgi:GNAT superfamily N-acetyltransferase
MIEYGIARKDQLPGILALYKQLVPDEEPIGIDEADKIWEKSERHGIKYFVAVDGNRIVSSLYLAIIPNLSRGGKSNGFIENVITGDEYRRRGIGKELIKMAVQYGKENNCYKVVLLSGMKRKESHLFYESCGFDGNSKRGFEIRF